MTILKLSSKKTVTLMLLYALHLIVSKWWDNRGDFDVMWHPWKAYLPVFFGKMSRLYPLINHVVGKVQGPTSTGDLYDDYFKNIFECSHMSQNYRTLLHTSSNCWFSGPVLIQGTCDTTLDLERVHLCHILKHWLRRLYHYLLPAKNEMKILVEMIEMKESAWLKRTARSVVWDDFTRKTHMPYQPTGSYCGFDTDVQ